MRWPGWPLRGAQSARGIQTATPKKLPMPPAALDTSTVIEDMDLPGFGLNDFKGQDKGRWAISVNANWRHAFEFRDGNAFVLDVEYFHEWHDTTHPIPVSSFRSSTRNLATSPSANLLALQDHQDLWSKRQQLDLSGLHRLEGLTV